jgi:hypothetical protein
MSTGETSRRSKAAGNDCDRSHPSSVEVDEWSSTATPQYACVSSTATDLPLLVFC